MLSKISPLIIFCLFIILSMNFFLFSDTEDNPVVDNNSSDPVNSEFMEEMDESPSQIRYTDSEFSNLSDEEKKNVYFNTPELLPENFDPVLYIDIFYPKTVETED